jgi:hypothetical protein
MSIRRVCAAVIVGLAMSAGFAGSSFAGSNDWYPKGAYGADAYHGKSFKRSNVSCDRGRDICYDRYGISYHATKRYLGEREANRAYKKYGKQVFLFSPKRGVICDRRTDSCSSRNWVGDNKHRDNSGWNNVARDGFGAIGSPNDWRHRQQPNYWQYQD